MIYLSIVIWNIFIFAGTAYLVAERGWSAWWFVLTVALMMYTKTPEENKCAQSEKNPGKLILPN